MSKEFLAGVVGEYRIIRVESPTGFSFYSVRLQAVEVHRTPPGSANHADGYRRARAYVDDRGPS